MPLLKAQSNLFTREDLAAGAVKTFIERGAGDIPEALGFREFTGEQSSFNIQKSSPGQLGSIDPYATTDAIDNQTHTYEKVSTEVMAIIKHADTPVVDAHGKSDENDQEALDIDSVVQLTYEEFVANYTSAMGLGTTARGLPYWAERYFGNVTTDYRAPGGQVATFSDAAGVFGGSGRAQFEGGVLYGTADFTVSGTKQALTDTFLDTIVTKPKRRPTAILTTLETRNAIKAILNDAGGNRGDSLMSEVFGRRMVHWDNVPVHVVDSMGDPKSAAVGVVSSTTLTVNPATAGNQRFPGFKPWDVGRTVSLGGEAEVIASVTSPTEVVLVAAPSGGNGNYAVSMAAKKDILFAVRFDEKYGSRAIYNPNKGSYEGPDVDIYGSAIAGFSVTPIGLLPNADVYRNRVRWTGNFEYCDPNSLLVAAQFTL